MSSIWHTIFQQDWENDNKYFNCFSIRITIHHFQSNQQITDFERSKRITSTPSKYENPNENLPQIRTHFVDRIFDVIFLTTENVPILLFCNELFICQPNKNVFLLLHQATIFCVKCYFVGFFLEALCIGSNWLNWASNGVKLHFMWYSMFLMNWSGQRQKQVMSFNLWVYFFIVPFLNPFFKGLKAFPDIYWIKKELSEYIEVVVAFFSLLLICYCWWVCLSVTILRP